MNALSLFVRPEPGTPLPPRATAQREVAQGAMAVSDDPGLELVATLGSCVSVCLYAEAAALGGMNHIFQTVHDRPSGDATVVAELETLVNAFMHAGLPRDALTARLAGGAHVLSHGRDYGTAIARACLGYLSGEAIPVVGVSIGGTRARRVRFHPATGRLAVALLAPSTTFDVKPPSSEGNAPEMF